MKIESYQGQEYWTVETESDLAGWDCSLNRAYKPGVHIIHAVRPLLDGAKECIPLYCPTEILERYAESQKPTISRRFKELMSDAG